MQVRSRTAIYAVLLVALQVGSVAADFPKHTGYVNDFSNLLSAHTRARLEVLLRDVEAETSAEIALAIVTSLDGMTVEEYGNRLLHAWGVGKEDLDNGVLVLVAPNEREMRIEVGYGLEPVLPDGLAGDIIRTNFLPHFREDRYEAGIDAGVQRIAQIVRRNHVLTTEERAALEEPLYELPTAIFLGVFVLLGFFLAGAGIASRTVIPLVAGSLFGGVPLLMSLVFNVPLYVLGPLGVAALACGVVVIRKRPDWINVQNTSGSGSHGHWVMGTFSGGSAESRSESSGGSSFGGGSSGGGGASGRW